MDKLSLEILPEVLGVAKLKSIPNLESMMRSASFFTFSKTDQELSIVTDFHQLEQLKVESARWRALRFSEVLDFSLKGILSKIAGILADAEISIFAISTYNTDYILVGEADFEQAISVLKRHYTILD